MYPIIKVIHVACAVLTVVGFMLRGYWMIAGSALLDHRITRIAPHIVDSIFLLSGVAMLVMLSFSPLTEAWMIAKFAGLVIYIGLGMLALRRGPTLRIRVITFIVALIVFGYIAGVAVSRSPLSWIADTVMAIRVGHFF